MTPEEKILLENTIKKLDDFIFIYNQYNFPSKVVFKKDVSFDGAVTLSKIEATTFGLGLTPVARQSAISAPSGGVTVDAEARTAINSIRTVLTTFGFTS